MNKEKVEEKAFDYFNSGFNCAEAVLRALVEITAEKDADCVTKIASAFGGGLGTTREELCGALSGGIMAIGYLMGRNSPGADNEAALQTAAKLRRSFLDKYGDTKCWAVLDKLGPQKNSLKCKRLTGELAGDLFCLFKDLGYPE
jgi:C_GCAxxG_C_C family probable redox protein